MRHRQRTLLLLIAVFLLGAGTGYIAGLWQQAAQHEKRMERMVAND